MTNTLHIAIRRGMWRILLTALLTVVLSASTSAAHAVTPAAVCDLTAAMEICDNRPLRQAEGIWRFPDDRITVLIVLDNAQARTAAVSYSLFVVESEDCRLRPGDCVGKLEETPDPDKFRLTLLTRRTGGVLSVPQGCLATLRDEGEAMTVRAPKLKVKLNPMVLFSKFWRLARIQVDNPLENLPAGMIKIYPGYDGNGSSTRIPRYL